MHMIPRFAPTASPAEAVSFLRDVVNPWGPGEEEVVRFEREFASWLGVPHALFVPSARLGLYMLLKASNYPAGSDIVVPAFTYFAIPAVVRLAGYNVVYADVEPTTFEISAATVKPVLTETTRAVIPTHLFGRTCPLGGLQKLCLGRGIDLVEDCAQATGARVLDRKAGAVGRAAYFTFGITKNFTTFSGGMVVCRDEATDRALRSQLSAWPPPQPQRLLKEGVIAAAMTAATDRTLFSLSLAPVLHYAPGPSDADPVYKAFVEEVRSLSEGDLERAMWRPTGAQAAAGRRQLLTVDTRNEARRQRGAALSRALARHGVAGVPAPASRGGDHIYVSFALRRPNRAGYGSRLRRYGVDFTSGYMSDCASNAALGGRPGLCPNATSAQQEIIHLPLYPGLHDEDIEHIAATIARIDRELGLV